MLDKRVPNYVLFPDVLRAEEESRVHETSCPALKRLKIHWGRKHDFLRELCRSVLC